MGTRGLFGFVYKGKYYLFYNQYDSYPSYLGANLLKEIKSAIDDGTLDTWKDMLVAIRDVSKEDPTAEDIQKLQPYTDLTVSNRSTTDWYCLTRKCQGSMINTLRAGVVYCHYSERTLTGDVFIEYSYVLNFDDKTFTAYTSNGASKVYPLNNLPSTIEF